MIEYVRPETYDDIEQMERDLETNRAEYAALGAVYAAATQRIPELEEEIEKLKFLLESHGSLLNDLDMHIFMMSSDIDTFNKNTGRTK